MCIRLHRGTVSISVVWVLFCLQVRKYKRFTEIRMTENSNLFRLLYMEEAVGIAFSDFIRQMVCIFFRQK